MRGAEALAGLAMEVFVEEQRIAPRRVVLEAGICSVRRSPALCVPQKQTEKAALELLGDLLEVCLLARSGRQFDRQVVAKVGMQMPQRLDREEVQRKPDRPAPVGVAAEEAGARFSRFVVEPSEM